ncbi:MAG TPA: hypothetical protein VNM89_07905 [Solirubrobacterales bacterium]|nr:hypothetical protein [Solirubrobacterales bacterium]
MLLAWVVLPLLLLAICAGLGLLVDAIGGRRLPGALIAPVGFAAAILLAQLATLAGAGVPLTAALVILLAGVGPASSLPWRFGRPDPWAVGAALAVFALFAAPVVLSGEPTFAAYGKADDIAGWLASADGDPNGLALPFAVAQQFLGGEAAWHFQPYVALLGALLSLCVWQIAASDIDHTRVGSKSAAPLDPRSRGLVAFLAAVPALIFGYAGLASPLVLGARVWLALAILAALTAVTVALSLWVARSQSPAALSAFAAALLGCAVLASANVGLAPYGSLSELRQVNERFAGEGPALIVEPDPLATRYFLRDLAPGGAVDPEEAGVPPSAAARGEPAEADQIDYRAMLEYSLLIVPRSPEQSRPPLPYRRVWLGEDYEVWRLPATATFRLLFHYPVGGPGAATGLPNCSETVGLGLLGLANQLGAPPEDISLVAAAPRRGARLGPTIAVPVDRASDLCGRHWDWIEAISPAG